MTIKHSIMQRSQLNPLITPGDIVPSFPDWEVLGAFNAGVAQYKDETILLLRVAERPRQDDPDHVIVPMLDTESERVQPSQMTTMKFAKSDPNLDFSDPRVILNRQGRTLALTSISHFRMARSRDGEHFTIDEKPTILPEGQMESWGVEDPRITAIDDIFYITYSAVSDKGVSVGLIKTKDFQRYQREGIMLAPTNKDVAIFPDKVGGLYYTLHRPVPDGIGRPEMWIASSPDLKHWGNHQFLMGLRDGLWDNQRIGAGCVPIKTDEGWLILYHGADHSNRYCMGASLLDLEHPERVLARLEEPILLPDAVYEQNGFFGHVVFACGAVVKGEQVTMYYGVSDDSMAAVTFELPALMSLFHKQQTASIS